GYSGHEGGAKTRGAPPPSFCRNIAIRFVTISRQGLTVRFSSGLNLPPAPACTQLRFVLTERELGRLYLSFVSFGVAAGPQPPDDSIAPIECVRVSMWVGASPAAALSAAGSAFDFFASLP